MTTEDIAQEVARLVRAEDERWQRGAEMVLTEGVEPVDCCPNNMAAGLVVQPSGRNSRTREIRRLQVDRSVVWLPVAHCPFCGVRYEKEST